MVEFWMPIVLMLIELVYLTLALKYGAIMQKVARGILFVLILGLGITFLIMEQSELLERLPEVIGWLFEGDAYMILLKVTGVSAGLSLIIQLLVFVWRHTEW